MPLSTDATGKEDGVDRAQSSPLATTAGYRMSESLAVGRWACYGRRPTAGEKEGCGLVVGRLVFAKEGVAVADPATRATEVAFLVKCLDYGVHNIHWPGHPHLKDYTDKFLDATGSNHLKLYRRISADGNTESWSKLNKDAIGVLSCERSPLAKLGKQVEQRMVNDLSAHPYNPVCPLSQGASSYHSSSQHIVSSSGEVKYIRNSGQETQIACEIAKEPIHIALYGSKNPYELTRLGNPRDKSIAPSSFEGVNISSISSSSSGMNLSTNSAKENNEYSQLKLQKQINGYQRFEN
uniref:Uncharacterized protein n=1 Tax=Oryza punctata TaxID=4537 RepID=A0A0E0L148_ORYPU